MQLTFSELQKTFEALKKLHGDVKEKSFNIAKTTGYIRGEGFSGPWKEVQGTIHFKRTENGEWALTDLKPIENEKA